MILHTTRFVCVHSHFHLPNRNAASIPYISNKSVPKSNGEVLILKNVQVQQKTMWQFVIFNRLWICHLYVAWCVKESRARQIPMNITIHILLTRNPGSEFNFIFSSFTFWMNDNFPFSSFFQMCPISRGNFCLLCSQYIRLPISLPRRKIGKI